MHAQCCHHEECQHIQVLNTPMPVTFANSPDVAAVSDDDSAVDSSPKVDVSESE